MPPVLRQLVMPRTPWGAFLPFQHASLEHLEARVRQIVTAAASAEDFSTTTQRWMHYAYRVFRQFLKESGSEAVFLAGDVRQQARVLQSWIVWMRDSDPPRRRATVNGYWRAMRILCSRIAAEDGALNPFLAVRAPHPGNARLECLTPEAARDVLLFVLNDDASTAAIRHRNAAIVGVMVLAGLRRHEVLQLHVADIDLDPAHAVVRVKAGKGRHGGKPRTVPLTDELRELFVQYVEDRRKIAEAQPTKALRYLAFFVGNDVRSALSETTIRRLFRRISRATGIRVTPHMLRHTFCTLVSRAGISDRLAKEAMGHADFKTLQRYQHVYEGELATEMQKLRLDIDLKAA